MQMTPIQVWPGEEIMFMSATSDRIHFLHPNGTWTDFKPVKGVGVTYTDAALVDTKYFLGGECSVV